MQLRNITVLGRSGSGKGTQIEILATKLSPSLVVHTGSLFRSLAEHPNFIGRRIKEVLQEGELQPTWLASFLWRRELVEKFEGNEHLIFDGSPRKVKEAEELDEVMGWLGRDKVEALLVDIPRDEGVKRLIKRARSDDTVGAIEERMEWFENEVIPVIEYYEWHGRLHRVDGVGLVEDIAKRIAKALKII